MDRELGLRIFSEEVVELLQEMESALLELESSPEAGGDPLGSVFRAVHTIKGSAGVVGLEDIEAFAHRVEEVLESVRAGETALDRALLELLLKSHDVIGSYISGSLDEKGRDAVLDGLSGYCVHGRSRRSLGPGPSGPGPSRRKAGGAGAIYHISIRFGRDVLRHGLDPLSFVSYLSRLGEVVSTTPLFDSMPGPAKMDPESCYLGLEMDLRSTAPVSDVEEVFEFLRDDCSLRIIPPGSPASSYLELIRSLPEDDGKLRDMLVRGGAVTREELDRAAGEAGSSVDPAAAQTSGSRTVRLDTEKLDRLVEAVGELVISGSAVQSHAERLRDEGLLGTASLLQKIVEVVRDGAMGLRMVPLSETFGRYQRVVRDIAREGGKEIRLEVAGGDTELDRKMVEGIRDPLTHLVRNAAGHGIESVSERLACGKPREGLVRLRAFQEAADVVIEVSDDGRGIDKDRAREHAVSVGIIAPDEELTPEALEQVIFSPGFSTASEVTTVSGRGVGMDAVRLGMERHRGRVSIRSEQGVGTTVRLTLPLTLAIMDGFLVRAAGRGFVVHMDSVLECLELPLDHSAGDRRRTREHIEVRGKAMPYIRISEALGLGGEPEGLEHVLIVRHGGRIVGLVVDELVGEVQTVVKPLGRLYAGVRGVSGATIQGDGSLALILDVPGLVGLALSGRSDEPGGPV